MLGRWVGGWVGGCVCVCVCVCVSWGGEMVVVFYLFIFISRCAGLSLTRPLLLQSTGSRHAGSVVVAHGPSCSAACGILPDQGSNPCPLHWQADSQPLRHQGSPGSCLLKPHNVVALKRCSQITTIILVVTNLSEGSLCPESLRKLAAHFLMGSLPDTSTGQ